MKLGYFIAKRLGYTVFALVGLSVLVFLIARVLPGDPVKMALGGRVEPEAYELYKRKLHLDKPLPFQYFYWLRDVLGGSLGFSLGTHRDVLIDVMTFLPASAELIVTAMIIDVIFAIPLGVLAGRYPNTWIDHIIRGFCYVGASVPTFVTAVMSLLIFGYFLNIMPTHGRISFWLRPPTVTGMMTVDALIAGNFEAFVDALKHLILPGFCLSIVTIAQECRITRASMVENLEKEYILAETAYGIPERIVMLKYLLKPSLIPTVAIMGLDFASRLGSAFVVELIFVFPGFSRYGLNAMLQTDLNAIVGVVIVIGLLYAVANLIVDVLVAYLDPRIRLVERAE